MLRKILLATILSAISCASPPKVTYCIQNVTDKVLHCSDSWQNNTYQIPYADSHRYICISPDDYQEILDWIAHLTEEAGIKGLR